MKNCLFYLVYNMVADVQGISSHSTDLFVLKYFGFGTISVK